MLQHQDGSFSLKKTPSICLHFLQDSSSLVACMKLKTAEEKPQAMQESCACVIARNVQEGILHDSYLPLYIVAPEVIEKRFVPSLLVLPPESLKTICTFLPFKNNF